LNVNCYGLAFIMSGIKMEGNAILLRIAVTH